MLILFLLSGVTQILELLLYFLKLFGFCQKQLLRPFEFDLLDLLAFLLIFEILLQIFRLILLILQLFLQSLDLESQLTHFFQVRLLLLMVLGLQFLKSFFKLGEKGSVNMGGLKLLELELEGGERVLVEFDEGFLRVEG